MKIALTIWVVVIVGFISIFAAIDYKCRIENSCQYEKKYKRKGNEILINPCIPMTGDTIPFC